jgi:hypothetical protein
MMTKPNRTAMICALLACCFLPAIRSARAADTPDFTKYLWEFPQATEVKLPASRHWMLEDLGAEVERIVAAGHLAPYYFNAGDLHHEGYFLYVAPGRIITTLSWAYPHLTTQQQTKVKEYVAKELANPKYAPWAGRKLPWNEGTGREGFGKPKGFNFDRWWAMEGQYRPYLHTLYGLWLYGHRTGDWGTIRGYWPQIKEFFGTNSDSAETYGELGAHLAMVRMARRFGDAEMEKSATALGKQKLAAALNYEAIEEASFKHFVRLKERRHNFRASTNFMLLNVTPEISRFLRDHASEPVLKKNSAIIAAYRDWWLIAPSYSSWAGNIGPDCEAIGLPREVFGMVYPVARWVSEASVDALSDYMRSGPDGLGDCYWLESLVWTIEAHGKTAWVDVR